MDRSVGWYLIAFAALGIGCVDDYYHNTASRSTERSLDLGVSALTTPGEFTETAEFDEVKGSPSCQLDRSSYVGYTYERGYNWHRRDPALPRLGDQVLEDGIVADLTGFDVIIPTCGGAMLRLARAQSGVSLRRWSPDGGPPGVSENYWVVVYELGLVVDESSRMTIELWLPGQARPSDEAPLILNEDQVDYRCWVRHPGLPRPCAKERNPK